MKTYAYHLSDLANLLRPQFQKGIVTTADAAVPILSEYLKLTDRGEMGLFYLKKAAHAALSALYEEVRLSEQMTPVFAQLYAMELRQL